MRHSKEIHALLCQGPPYVQCCPLHILPLMNKVYLLIWTGYLDLSTQSGSVMGQDAGKIEFPRGSAEKAQKWCQIGRIKGNMILVKIKACLRLATFYYYELFFRLLAKRQNSNMHSRDPVLWKLKRSEDSRRAFLLHSSAREWQPISSG